MAILMLYDRDNSHDDPNIDYSGAYKKGYVVETFHDSKRLVLPPEPPFVFLKIIDKTKEDVDAYIREWRRAIDYTVLARDVGLDGWRVEIKANNPNVSGKGHLTREMVENYLTSWNCPVVDFVNHGVRFDVKVGDVLRSSRFWERDTSLLVFNEIAYDQQTGLHTTEVNYSALPVPPGTPSMQAFEDRIRSIVEDKGGAVISNSGGVIVFNMHRDTVMDEFREDLMRAVRHVVCRRQIYLAPEAVDAIIANERYMEASAKEIARYVRSRMDE